MKTYQEALEQVVFLLQSRTTEYQVRNWPILDAPVMPIPFRLSSRRPWVDGNTSEIPRTSAVLHRRLPVRAAKATS